MIVGIFFLSAYKRFKQIDPLSGFSYGEKKGSISYMFVADGIKELKVRSQTI